MLHSPPTRSEIAPLNGALASPQPAPLSPAPQNLPLQGGDTWDVGAMLLALWRRKRLMLTTFLLVLLAGTLLTLRQRPVYEAICSILISSPTENSAGMSDSLRSLMQGAQPRSVGTQLAIMRSYPVQRATLNRLSPAEQQLAREFYRIEVRPQRDSDAIDIVAQSRDPRVAARLANALSEEYMAQYQEQNRLQVIAGTREVAAQLAGARKRLNEVGTAIKNYKMGQGTINLAEESSARLAQSNQIEIALRDLQAERAATAAQVSALQNQISGMAKVQTTPDRIVRSPALEALRGQLVQLDLQRIATLRRYRAGSPEVRAIDAQRADIQDRLETISQTEISSWTRSVNPVRQGLSQDIARAQTQIESIDARIAALRGAQGRARAQEALLPQREYEIGQLLGDQKVLQQTYQVLNEKYQSLLVSEGSKLSTARPLAPAEAPENPVRPRRALNLAMTLLLGTLLALGLALLAEKTDDRIRSAQGAQHAAQLPVLAQIPVYAGASRPVVSAEPSDSALESFRLLRTNLMMPGAGGAPRLPRSILVTSPRAGQDASQVALQLALAIIQSGKSVILIETDMRHPQLRAQFEGSTAPGLSEVLRGEQTLDQAIQTTGAPNLRFLNGGEALEGAAELLGTDASRQVLQNAMARADCAVVSCPPVLGYADTPILATFADCALLVVSSEESQSSEIAQAKAILARTGVFLPGLVLNNVKTSST